MPPMHDASAPLFAQRPLWSGLFWAGYWAWILFETWVFARDRRAARGQRSDRGSLPVILGLVAVGVALAFTAPGFAPRARIAAAPAAVFGAAMALLWAGMALRLWAILTLGRFFRIAVFVQDGHRLVTFRPLSAAAASVVFGLAADRHGHRPRHGQLDLARSGPDVSRRRLRLAHPGRGTRLAGALRPRIRGPSAPHLGARAVSLVSAIALPPAPTTAAAV